MKCSKCGTDLIQGNNICPSCGTDNTPVETTDGIEMPQIHQAEQTPDTSASVLDEGGVEVLNVTENMSAPKLELESENLTTGTSDISNEAEVSTYDPSQNVPQDNRDISTPKEAQVNFQLPEVKEGTKDTQGMDILNVSTTEQTAGTVETPGKKKFSLKILTTKTFSRKFVIIAVIIALLIGGVIGSLMFGKQVYTPGTTRTTKKATVKHVADGKNNVTYAGNYIYKIPTDFDFDKNNGGVVLYSSNDDYRILIKSLKGNYDYLANSKESIRKSLENNGITVGSIVETVINEKRYIVIEGTYGTHNRLYAFRQGDNNDVFYTEIVAVENKYDYDALNIADDIINNVEYNEKYSNMESIQYEDISAVVIKAAEAYNKG